jgi:hypothetical protein
MSPAPLVSPEVDLRDFAFMPLDVVRLRDSDLAAVASGDGFRAAVLLWCAAWHQLPAASLPNDNRMLARFAGYGRDLNGWTEVRDEALRGFVECSDGRLYHATIAEKANEGWKAKLKRREQVQAAIKARSKRDKGDDPTKDMPPPAGKGDDPPKDTPAGNGDVPRNDPPNDPRDGPRDGQRDVHQGTGTGIEIGKESSKADALDGSAPKRAEPKPTPRSELSAVVGDELAAEVVDHRQRMRKPLTVQAAGRLAKQFLVTGAPQDAARMMIDRGWQGFNAEWFENARSPPARASPPFGSPLKTNVQFDVILESIEDERNGISYDKSLF